MLLYYIIMYLMRWCALYLVGGQVAFWFNGVSPLGDGLITLGMAGFMWLIGMGLDFMLQHPSHPKFLNTKKKRIIAAAASFLLGFFSFISAAGV